MTSALDDQHVDLTLVADKLALRELVDRLARSVDRKDRDAIASCYSAKSFDDHGRWRGSGQDFADWIANPDPRFGGSPFMAHQMGQSLWEIEGDEAFGETYYLCSYQAEPGRLFYSIGRYEDYCQRNDGRWTVTYRRVVIDWDGTVDATDAVPGGHFRASRDSADPSWTRLKWPVDPSTPTSIG